MDNEGSDWLSANRAMWNRKATAHLRSSLYDVPGFLDGKLSLQRHEMEDLADVRGKDLVHLQCHIGLDTLSWARLGANVTGLDFSEASIRVARQIANDTGLEARFVVGDVYEAPAKLGRTFDVVYTGVGALCWLPDLQPWADIVAALLRPRGQLYLFEFHPIEWMLASNESESLDLRFDYFTPKEGFREGGAVSYADAGAEDQDQPTVQWNHPLGEVVTALAKAGMVVEELRELDRSVLERWKGMEKLADGMFRPLRAPNLPLMYVLQARLRLEQGE